MKLKCKCGSENITIYRVDHYTYGPLKGKVFQFVFRCWDCDCGESLLDRGWKDNNTPIMKYHKQ